MHVVTVTLALGKDGGSHRELHLCACVWELVREMWSRNTLH